ncbi:hypothetical protein [Dyadobacter arcticus]|uniref:DUF4595 domain-containing protein n=1 Tax=Dyadobacter arcticus TaxID=1078754 RepID=A0ABX0UMJ9_9BACT|nr:hypothetical protein [Dyadobacter arcticus]NIJ54157.1 hypothetical protein [Dyadobacter arcticus]
MKKLLYLFAVISFLACKNEKDADPDLSFLDKQQAPFGRVSVDVKLRKLLYNGRLLAEYIYEGDYFSQEKRYATFAVPAHYGTGSFKRNAGIPESFEMVSAFVSPEGGWVSTDFKPTYNLKFSPAANDSVRNIVEEYFTYPQISYKDYTFDGNGFVIRESQTKKSAPQINYHAVFSRDAQHNIRESLGTIYDQNGKSGLVKFDYDDHPNPFFKMGIDWQGQMSVSAFSPNNIVRETRIGPDGVPFHINYTYEYFANGYPEKVSVKADLPLSQAYTIEFIY